MHTLMWIGIAVVGLALSAIVPPIGELLSKLLSWVAGAYLTLAVFLSGFSALLGGPFFPAGPRIYYWLALASLVAAAVAKYVHLIVLGAVSSALNGDTGPAEQQQQAAEEP